MIISISATHLINKQVRYDNAQRVAPRNLSRLGGRTPER
jgi:hypothetical protein